MVYKETVLTWAETSEEVLWYCILKKVLFTAAIQSARLKNFIMHVCTYQSQFPVFGTVPTVAKRASKPSSANGPKSEEALKLDRNCVCG